MRLLAAKILHLQITLDDFLSHLVTWVQGPDDVYDLWPASGVWRLAKLVSSGTRLMWTQNSTGSHFFQGSDDSPCRLGRPFLLDQSRLLNDSAKGDVVALI